MAALAAAAMVPLALVLALVAAVAAVVHCVRHVQTDVSSDVGEPRYSPWDVGVAVDPEGGSPPQRRRYMYAGGAWHPHRFSY